MEAEARAVLSSVTEKGPAVSEPEEDIGTAVHRRFAGLGGVEFRIPRRGDANAELKDGLETAIHRLFAPHGGVDLELPSRNSHRKMPSFDE